MRDNDEWTALMYSTTSNKEFCKWMKEQELEQMLQTKYMNERMCAIPNLKHINMFQWITS